MIFYYETSVQKDEFDQRESNRNKLRGFKIDVKMNFKRESKRE